MSERFYTQGVALLCARPVPIAELTPWLSGFKILGKSDAAASWTSAGPTISLELEKGSKGRIVIDTISRVWPDLDSESEEIAEAREAGQFGPTSADGGLARARQFCAWEGGADLAGQHQAFLRVRVTYAPESAPHSTELPASYSATRESEHMLAVAEALMDHPATLCYFNPSGEALASKEILAKSCEHFLQASQPAVSVLSNRRFAKLEGSDWMVVDMVGLEQLDFPDLEVAFSERYDPNEIAVFLVNTALALLKSGQPLKDGYTLAGPKGVLFEAKSFNTSQLPPSREVFRFRPRDGTVSPSELGFGDKPFGKRAWWQFWKL